MGDSIYDPKKVIIDFGGLSASGYAKGVFFKIGRNEDGVKLNVGAGGEFVVTRNNNRSGQATLTLQQDSLYNDYLSEKAQLFQDGGGGVAPFFVKDLHGNTMYHAEKAWVRKVADSEFSDEATNREWMFEFPDLEIFVGGAD